MPNTESHAPGSFCWIELATTDQAAAKEFYTALFSWGTNDFPMGPDGVYTIFREGDRDAGAACSLNPQQIAQGVPPHWMLYIASADVDATAVKVKEAGGTVVAGPFDVMDLGRMCVCQDPAGAFFCVWQSERHKGLSTAGAPGTFCWADLSVGSPEVAGKFYTSVFGWEITGGKDSGYLHIKNGEQFIGGIPPAEYRDPNAPPHWLIYFAVEDVDATAAKAGERGSKILLKPSSIEMVGRLAVLADPQGGVFAIFKEAAPAAH